MTSITASLDVEHVNPVLVRCGKATSVGTDGSVKMQADQKELPEELLEMIIAKMPFPSFFKSRVLSKRWYSKFPFKKGKSKIKIPVESQVDSCEASAFQREVSANSAGWAAYAPVLFSSSNMSLLAFDKILVVPSPPMWSSIRNSQWDVTVLQAGALVLVHGEPFELFVSNILTGSCRHLTVQSYCQFEGFGGLAGRFGIVSLVAVGCHSYKALVVHYIFNSEILGYEALCAHLYDSRLQTWTFTQTRCSGRQAYQALTGFAHFYKHSAYMDGKIYYLARYVHPYFVSSLKLVSFDLEDKAWRIVIEIFDFYDPLNHESGVFCCRDKLIVVILTETATAAFSRKKIIKVSQLDMLSLELICLSEGTPEILAQLKNHSLSRIHFSSDATFIYMSLHYPPGSVFKLNLNSRKWSLAPAVSSPSSFNDMTQDFIKWAQGTFEPGLNPFLEP